MHKQTEPSLPRTYWGALSLEDRQEFLRLRQQFLQNQRISAKDRRIVSFRKELETVRQYIERSSQQIEERSIICGICFAGRCICVNTRQLKNFLGRCKSSINGSFQQIGYVALRTKAKARNCVITVMPTLQKEQIILRQWTVRYASEEAQVCINSSFSTVPLPIISDDDLYDDRRASSTHTAGGYPQPMTQRPVPQQRAMRVEFDLPEAPSPQGRNLDLPISPSMDFTHFGTEWEEPGMTYDADLPLDWDQSHSMTRSTSAYFPNQSWDFLDQF